MTMEQYRPKRPFEIFDITEEEATSWRVSDEKLKEILATPNTSVHDIQITANDFGEFLYLTASRTNTPQRTYMVFYGLGYHQSRERWITQEWFWYQVPQSDVDTQQSLTLEEAEEQLAHRLSNIMEAPDHTPQSPKGYQFEQLADVEGDDEALAKTQKDEQE